jgi:hypothetical protein
LLTAWHASQCGHAPEQEWPYNDVRRMEPNTTPRELAQILGEDAASFVSLLVNVVARFTEHRYEFMSQTRYGELLQTSPSEAMHIYWLEILYRANFASSVSLLRSKRWLDGLIIAARYENYVLFMASLRGFLESAADSFHSLQDVPTLLADSHAVVRKAIKGQLSQMVLSTDLENTLIHFTHARRLEKDEHAPSSHRARQIKEYLESLAIGGDYRLAECYRELCEVTHPAASSVMCFAQMGQDSIGTIYELVSQPDSDHIRHFCESYRDVMLRIVSLGVMPPLVTLRLINEFDERSLLTEAVTNVGIEGHNVWKQIAARLRDSAPPTTRRATKADGISCT